jgi:hypothetical protein
VTGVVAIVAGAAAGPADLVLSPGGDRGVTVDGVGLGTTTTIPTTASSLPAPEAARPVLAQERPSSGRGEAAAAPAPTTAAAVVADTSARQSPRSPDGAPAEPTGSAGEGCGVYSKPGTGVGPVAGPGGDSVVECTYTATRPGGYSGSGTWTLDIVRDGRTITFDSVRGPACQPVGLIRPGDVVRAHLGIRTHDGTYSYASAGSGEWHLDAGTWVRC